jgi:hypothetical protein
VSEPSVPTYEIEFYEDDRGHEPALAFMQSLTGPKRRAIGIAINEFLRYLGPDVVRTDFGKKRVFRQHRGTGACIARKALHPLGQHPEDLEVQGGRRTLPSRKAPHPLGHAARRK